MATSTELENVGREHYMVKDVKAKIQVDLISKDSKKTEVDDQDFYVCVNRDVESKFIKADESSEDKIDQFIVKHHETITIVQGLANTKLTNPDNWIIKIKRKLSETTFFKGKEIIDKISQRQENLERNKENPIVKAAIAKELLKRSKQEQKIGSIHNKEPLDENQNSIGDEKGNQHFMAETSPETSPDTSKDDEQGDITVKADVETINRTETLKIATEEKKVENGTTNVESVKREVVSKFGPSNSTLNNQSEKDVEKRSLKSEKSGTKSYRSGQRYMELPAGEEIPNEDISATGLSNSLKNQSEKESLKSENSGTKSYRSGQRYVELPAGKEIPNEGISATGPSTLDNQSEKDVEIESLKSEKSGTKLNRSGERYMELPAGKEIPNEGISVTGPSLKNQSEKESLKSEKFGKGYVELPAGKEIPNVPSNPTEILKLATVEAEVENGTTNQTEKITNENGAEKTSLKYKKSEAKSNVSGDMELPERVSAYLKTKSSSIEYGPIYKELLKQKELASDPNELKKIERALEQEASKIKEQTSSVYAKEDPEAGAEIGTQRVREVFHMDVAELIIERDN